MKHYPHHIGDFNQATRHLTRLERSIYRDLIELYYDTEQPLPLDINVICRKILARSNEEATAVEQTLNEFFNETPNGWYHERCEAEISKYRAYSSQKALAGKASAAKREEKRQRALNGCSTDVERESNGTSTNHKPKTNTSVAHEKIVFDGSRFENINGYLATWKAAYPAIDVEGEIAKAAAWLVANPKNTKSQYSRFLNGWLSRAQDKAPRASSDDWKKDIL